MGILDRRKKNGEQGFKDFVRSVETAFPLKRKDIIQAAALDDITYTQWAIKNILTFYHLMDMDEDNWSMVLKAVPNYINILLQALNGIEQEELVLSKINPMFKSKYLEDKEYLGEVKDRERISCQLLFVKKARELQDNGKISILPWNLPNEQLITFKRPSLNAGVWAIKYETGQVAATGELINYEREGYWEHLYPSGQKMACGNYHKGMKTGKWEMYFQSGDLMATGEYVNDQKKGDWEIYTKNGDKSTQTY